jgi:cupin superfamily acireductone dioxygenase involved in methionine salvage
MPPKKAASAEEKPKTASKRKAEDDGSTQEPKKQRAPRSITGVSAEDFNATKPAPLKKQYNQMVKKFHKMVDGTRIVFTYLPASGLA